MSFRMNSTTAIRKIRKFGKSGSVICVKKIRKAKRITIIASATVLLVLGAITLLQIFMFGKIVPGPKEQALTIAKPDAVSENKYHFRSGYYNTTWPSEHADLIRSHAVLSGGLPDHFDKTMLQVTSTELDMPTWGYTRDQNEIFVIGGSPQFLTTFTQSIEAGKNIPRYQIMANTVADVLSKDIPYVAKINSVSKEKTILKLNKGHTVNYTGGLLMHANGYVYAVSQSVLYKIDPVKMKIVKSVELPKTGNSLTAYWTTYNGLQALNNGELVLKGFHLINNANLDGYLLLIDPDTLQIDLKQKARVSSARLAIDGDYLYHVNAQDVLRYKITDKGFLLDHDFSTKYRDKTDKSTQGSSPMLLPKINMLVFADNTAPGAKTPIKLYTKSTLNSNTPMKSANAFSTDQPSFNFFMVGGDTYLNNIVIYYDPLNNLVTANKIEADGSITLLWKKNNIKASASPAIAAKNGYVYLDDYKNSRDSFIILSLQDGAELGRIQLPASLPTVGTIFIGENNDVFLLSSEAGKKTGYISRITAP